jgi:hypothetical protein
MKLLFLEYGKFIDCDKLVGVIENEIVMTNTVLNSMMSTKEIFVFLSWFEEGETIKIKAWNISTMNGYTKKKDIPCDCGWQYVSDTGDETVCLYCGHSENYKEE